MNINLLELDLNSAFIEIAKMVDQRMYELMPEFSDDMPEKNLLHAMSYSSILGGKRLRPFLVIVVSQMFKVPLEYSLRVAAAIEFIHAYSLIHDDLPAMDNDDLRRGMPSCHIKFGEAQAILAGDALQSLAFEILSHPETHPSAEIRCELVYGLAKAIGATGMVAGQVLDMESEKRSFNMQEIIRMQRMKTGELFNFACEAGAILSRVSPKLRHALKRYAHDIGLAFQITDDLLDVLGNEEVLGKKVNTDSEANKSTLVSFMGVEKAKEQAEMLIDQAIAHIAIYDSSAKLLRDLAYYIISRDR